ncbi:MAG: four helix bundle protein [Ignavibacteriaceae bacterium]
MLIKEFEDIQSWQIAKSLYIESKVVFKEVKDTAFLYQYFRAALSIMNNIGEGFERRTSKEFGYFLNVAKGSAAEVRSMLHIAVELKYCNEENYNLLITKCISVSKLIAKLSTSIK